jgi:serine/threonine-protein kinase RsbW
MILKLSMYLPEDQDYLRLTRLLGRTLLEYLQADPLDMIDVEMLLGELCSNVVRHARTCNGRFRVTLEYYAHQVVIFVEDTGPGFSFKAVPAVGSVRAETQGDGERIGGFGLQLVEGLADRIEFRRSDPHGTTVRAEKALHYQSQAAAQQALKMDESPRGGGLELNAFSSKDSDKGA